MRTTIIFLKPLRPAYCCAILIALTAFLVTASAAALANGSRSLQTPSAPVQSEIEKQKQRLNATDVEERRDAVMRLGALHRAEASRLVIPALADPAAIVRVAAAVAVQSLPADESSAALIRLLSDLDPFVRQEVAYALGRIRHRNAVAPLVERLNMDKDNGVLGAAAVALGMIADEEAVVALAQVITPPTSASRSHRGSKGGQNSFVVRAAVRSLGQIKSSAGVPALIAALSNDSLEADVRREAAEALGVIADPASAPALRAATAKDDPLLSLIAFQALRKIEVSAREKTP